MNDIEAIRGRLNDNPGRPVMTRNGVMIMFVLAVCVLSGCNLPTPGSPRVLGDVDYASAFSMGREVMGQYYSIASADPDTGIIQARPTKVEVRPERLLGGSPARHLATLRIIIKDGRVVAYASVVLQREGSAIHRTIPRDEDNYSGVPIGTPADETAATTPEQNELWQTERYDHPQERRILDDLYKRLHSEGK